MKRSIKLMVLMTCLALGSDLVFAQAARFVMVRSIQGRAEFSMDGYSWYPVQPRMMLRLDAQVRTYPNSSIEILFNQAGRTQQIVIGPYRQVQLSALQFQAPNTGSQSLLEYAVDEVLKQTDENGQSNYRVQKPTPASGTRGLENDIFGN